MTWAIQV